ncbi:MAG: tetratricopeptide repeat protein [Candidatus Electrothrix sp. EH2]|nr:tetratricopeptide repeat protein [Candidatus Electrothrix sp. EH2]
MNSTGFKKITGYLIVLLIAAGIGIGWAMNGLAADQEEISTDDKTAAIKLKDELESKRKAVELDPDNMESWNELEHLLRRTGKLDQAEEAYNKVLSLAEANQDKDWQAAALGNLARIYQTRGDLDKAEEMYRKGLELDKALGRKEGMAQDYGNLGIVYEERGDLDKAEELWKKSLGLYQEMGAGQHPDAKIVQQYLDKLAQERSAVAQ